MLKFFAAGTLCVFTTILIPQKAFASGKTAYVMTCSPGYLGEIVIEPMIYDNAGPHTFDNVPQYNDRNFFELNQRTKEKLSESLVEGNVIKKDLRWTGQTLIGYLEEFARSTLPKEKRSLTTTVPQDEKGHRGPGSVVTMNIEDTNISCEFTTPKDIYTEISVDFYRTSPNASNTCNVTEDVMSLHVNWYTEKDTEAVKSADIHMSCGHRAGPDYNVSMAKVTTNGSVTVDLQRTQVLQQPDRLLYRRGSGKLLNTDNP